MFVHMPSRLQSKLDPKAEKCVFINYSPSKKGYEFYNPQIKKKKIVIINVSFMEVDLTLD